MSKTKEELNALKEGVETVSRKLHELSDDELELVSGGGAGKNGCEGGVPIWIKCNGCCYFNGSTMCNLSGIREPD